MEKYSYDYQSKVLEKLNKTWKLSNSQKIIWKTLLSVWAILKPIWINIDFVSDNQKWLINIANVVRNTQWDVFSLLNVANSAKKQTQFFWVNIATQADVQEVWIWINYSKNNFNHQSNYLWLNSTNYWKNQFSAIWINSSSKLIQYQENSYWINSSNTTINWQTSLLWIQKSQTLKWTQNWFSTLNIAKYK